MNVPGHKREAVGELGHVEVTNAKVLWDGESLAGWASRVAERIQRCGASRLVL